MNLACPYPNLWIIRAYFLHATFAESSDFAPVTTIFPDEKIRAVVLGSLIRIITAAKRLGLYSAFRAFNVIRLRSNCIPKLTVDTTFWMFGVISFPLAARKGTTDDVSTEEFRVRIVSNV
eukprot:530298-Hanusia_phi.AAC.1